jgi:NADPH:quinone reductase-like Zn-dependent oxidoreductase
MRAITLKGFGGVENLVETEEPVPEISDNEVLVKVKAFSINPVDIKTRNGKGVAAKLNEHNTTILGWDFSGVILYVGKSVSSLKKGDEVFGLINFPDPGKTYSEYVVAPESQLALKPANITHEEAAAGSLAALTAWQIVKEKVGIKPGYNVLIHSAAGGVGHYAVQMAKYLGAYVIGTASGQNRDFVIDLGASEHVDYERERFEHVVNDIDFVLDTRGGDYIDRSLEVLKPGGIIISIPSGSSEDVKQKAEAKGFKGETFSVRPNGKNMKEIADLLKEGVVKSYISKTFKLEEIQLAHKQIETGKTKGKIVVSLL